MCDQRGPSADDFKKMPQAPAGLFTSGQPLKHFCLLLLRLTKVNRTTRDWCRKKAWMPSPTRPSAASETQTNRRRTNKKTKPYILHQTKKQTTPQ
jgi:hypothetical protein